MRWLVFASLLTGCGRFGFDAAGARGSVDAADATGPVDTTGVVDAPPAVDSPVAVDGPLVGDGPPAMIVDVQTGPVATSTGGPVTATLPAASTAGTLLVASIATNDPASLALPAGWMIAVQQTVSGNCSSTIAYLADNPGGIASVPVGINPAVPMDVVLGEYSGVATTSPVDAIGTATSNNPVSAQPITSTGSTTIAGDVGIVVFCEDSNNPTYATPAGWTNLGRFTAASAYPSFTSDVRLALPVGPVTVTETASVAGKYQAAVATFRAP